MRVSTMRLLDRWLGVPACAALTAARRVRDSVRRNEPADAPRRILFVKLAEQGATVLAYAAVCRATERVGRENVYFLVFEENRFILDVMEMVPPENVITLPTDGLGRLLAGTWRALGRLRRLRIDTAIDLEFFARSSAVLTYLSGAKQRVGLHRFSTRVPYRGDLMTHRVPFDPDLHTADLFAKLVEALDQPPGELLRWASAPFHALEEPPYFQPRADELAEVREIVRGSAGTAQFSPLVLLNANASDLLPLRRWPSQRYVDLARRILAHNDSIHVAFTGAPSEAEPVTELVRRVGSERCFSLAGKTTLRQLLVLYTLADLLVTNDSGPAHFATLTPIQVIALFGPETPARFGARSNRTRLLWKSLRCSPCVSAENNRLSPCDDNRCMQQITVDEVFQHAVEMLRPPNPWEIGAQQSRTP